MPRSYFARLTSGTSATPLLPARPVTNLWKTMRLESMAAIGDPPRSQISSERALGRANRGRMAATESTVITKSRTDLHGARHEQQQERSSARERISKTETGEPHLAIQDRMPKPLPAEFPHASEKKIGEGVHEPPERPRPFTTARIDLKEAASGTELRPADLHASFRDRAVKTGDREFPAAAPEPRKSVHIGKVEVQIVPAAPPARSARPPQPKARLARGYNLWVPGQHL